MKQSLLLPLVCAVFVLLPLEAFAQESKSAPLTDSLVKLLDEMKLDSVAARQPGDVFVSALYLPGSQLLVVRGRFASAERATILVDRKMYRDVYADLNSAPNVEDKIFVSDLGADGLRFRPENNQPFDTVDMPGKSYSFDGDWGRAKLSRDEYTKAFEMADTEYSAMLQALLDQLKKSS